ncbi:MAG: hypothetical protein GY715_16500 [Planctomycetes bacterium]|nr:hypothetical protein [Planctomycetota bacterium]
MIAGVLSSAAVAAIGAWGILAVVRRDRRQGGPLVRRLARGLRLGVNDRRLVQRVARRAGLPGAGAMLLSAGCFDHAVRHVRRDGPASRRLRAIRAAVFEGNCDHPVADAGHMRRSA